MNKLTKEVKELLKNEGLVHARIKQDELETLEFLADAGSVPVSTILRGLLRIGLNCFYGLVDTLPEGLTKKEIDSLIALGSSYRGFVPPVRTRKKNKRQQILAA